jgi:septum formation protein
MARKIILASGSPRRKELLGLAGAKFEIFSPDVDETILPREGASAMVKRLSVMKAGAVSEKFKSAGDTLLIVAADTTVVSPEGRILGKPADLKEAVKMVSSLQGRMHKVLTGYCILEVVRGKVLRARARVVGTRVWIRPLNPSEVKAYVARGESLDKAGAYAAQGFGMAIVEKISGSYTNVVGLPVKEVVADLKELGWSP